MKEQVFYFLYIFLFKHKFIYLQNYHHTHSDK